MKIYALKAPNGKTYLHKDIDENNAQHEFVQTWTYNERGIKFRVQDKAFVLVNSPQPQRQYTELTKLQDKVEDSFRSFAYGFYPDCKFECRVIEIEKPVHVKTAAYYEMFE